MDTGSSSSTGSQQEGMKKTAKLQLLFNQELKSSDIFDFCSLPDELGEIFLEGKDGSGNVVFTDLQSGEERRFHLGICEASGAQNPKYKFGKGWLQYVQAKSLAAGDLVTFYSATGVSDSGQSHPLQFYLECSTCDRPEPSEPDQVGIPLHEPHNLMSPESTSPDFTNSLHLLNLFPKDYEIDRDTLIQLFLAAGLQAEESDAVACLNTFERSGYLSRSRQEDEGTWKLWYKVTGAGAASGYQRHKKYCQFPENLDGELVDSPFYRKLPLFNTDLEHVIVQQLPTGEIQDLQRLRNLKTLWFLHGHKTHVDHVPHHIFSSLKLLRVLNLSRTQISELPNSIRYAKGLLYLDLSDTLLKNLPESIGHLQDLQTLKLQNCRDLLTLPKSTFRLLNLQHLDLGTLCCLHSMPLGIGALTHLRTLSTFLVGYEPGGGIAELGNLQRLQGELCLSRLENVASSVEAMAADLHRKSLLRSLVLQWSRKQRSNSRVANEVIKYLRPNTNLKSLQVLGYGGSQFPNWIADPSFTSLVSINLSNSENCQLLPSLGRLPTLKSLTLHKLNGIRVIDYQFYRGTAHIEEGNDDLGFPMLQNLALISLLSLEEWRDVCKSDFPSLLKLEMKDCPKLVEICSLSDMHSLQHLEISNCPLLPSLPEGHLPASVKELVIEDCPALESSCSKPDGEDWHKIEHVGSIWIDYEDISSL